MPRRGYNQREWNTGTQEASRVIGDALVGKVKMRSVYDSVG